MLMVIILKITNFNVPKSNVKLDMEYSQKLSDDDMNFYVKIVETDYKKSDDFKKESLSIKKKLLKT